MSHQGQGQGQGGRRADMSRARQSPSPFRPPMMPPPGWNSPIPLRMTQSPPPFLIRPMVGRQSPAASRSPSIGSPIPMFGMRWSPGSGSPIPPPPPHMIPGRQFFHPIVQSQSPPVGPPHFMQMSNSDAAQYQDNGFSLQPSYDMELVYPPGLDTIMMHREVSVQSEDTEDGGLTTAEIIAAQSQDYIDERLAEYQATIQHLQDEQERVQKKTFVNWINSYLAKHIPPLHLVDLIEDLKDGTRLLALLEVLSNQKLPLEKGRNLRRPHFLSNCNTALQFLQSKKIKLVNINSSDVVDGKPAVVLGLVWTIILYFQIEENTRVLAGLGYRLGQPTPTPGQVESPVDHRSESARIGTESPSAINKQGRVTPSERWKLGARKALLQWVQGLVSKKFGIDVSDFGNCWRDGYAFLAIINCIQPGLVDIESLRNASNRTRLETAFRVAELELGVPRLLDPEDVDVPRPDEKSIMTYVAQFLHKSNEPRVQADSFSAVQAIYDELLTWLMQKTQYMEHMKQTNALSLNYRDYVSMQEEMNSKADPYNRLQTLVESLSMVGITEEAWLQLKSLWKKLESQLREWHWILDSHLPPPFGEIGQWLAKAELLLSTSDVPGVMDDEAARILNAKIEDHKVFFSELHHVHSEFTSALNLPFVKDLPPDQMNSMAARLNSVGPLAAKRVVKLKFLEHKCCLVAFIVLVENRLKQWTIKYGRQNQVQGLLEQYNNFVNRNKIFQEFQRAYIDMQHVIDEYKREGGIDHREGRTADHFLWEVGERWKSVSMELRCVQSMLEEVIGNWRRYDAVAPELNDWIDRSLPMVQLPEDQRMEYFQDISIWLEKYQQLNETVSFLIATCDTPVTNELKSEWARLSAKWDNLFPHVKQYQYAGQMIRMRKDFLEVLSGLQKWLRNAEDTLQMPQPASVEAARIYSQQLQQIQDEIDEMDEQWRAISKRFQSLLPELSGEEVERLMAIIKKEKECLVRVRAQLPLRQSAVHQLLTQQEALESGQREIADWLSRAEVQMSSYNLIGGLRTAQDTLDRHKHFFAKTIYYKTMLDSKNKLHAGMLTSAGPNERSRLDDLGQQMKGLNSQFTSVEQNSRAWEQKLNEAIRCWKNYDENKQTVVDWMNTAEKLLNEKNLESRQTVEAHKSYFEQINNRPLKDMAQASQDLRHCVTPEESANVEKTVEQLKLKWNKIMSRAPIHLTKLEFRLEEEVLAAILKEMDREITNEQQLLNKRENTQAVLERHSEFFEHGRLPPNARKCLEKLAQIESRFVIQHPEDQSLTDQLNQARSAYESVSVRAKNILLVLEEIPEQWKLYKTKFENVVKWMDSVDLALKGIMTEVNDADQFENEKARFLSICRDVDMRRDDMKQLVQMLDSLVSRRADEDALKEQDLLENLIQRYKNLVPTIEVTMIKTETHSRCYTFREETKRICQVLDRFDKISSRQDMYPDSLEEVEQMIKQQQAVLKQLEDERATIVSLLQRGKDLQRDPNAPRFVQIQVQELDRTWSDVYGQSQDKLKHLRETHKVWISYRAQRDDILHLLEDAEVELKKLTSGQTGLIPEDLKAKQEMSRTLRDATEDTLKRLRDLSQSLVQVSKPEKKPILEREIEDIEKRMHAILDLLEEKIKHLLTHDEKWSLIMGRIEELRNWMNDAQKLLQQLLTMDMPPEERVRKTKELQEQIAEKMKILQSLEREAMGLIDADSPAEIQEVKIITGEVDALKEGFVNLHETVQSQKAESEQALQVYTKCKGSLDEFNPWLEKAEVQLAVGVPKPATLEEALINAQNIEKFALDCKSQQAQLTDIAGETAKIPKLAYAQDDVDSAKTKLVSVSTSVFSLKDKSGNLHKAWQNYEIDYNKFDDAVKAAEKKIAKPLNYAELTLPNLEARQVELKDLNKEISALQSQLVTLNQDCNSVAHQISPESAAILTNNLTVLRAKLVDLADSSRAGIADLSNLIMARQEFDSKVSNLDLWMDHFSSSINLPEDIYFERLDSSLSHINTLAQEHSEHRPDISEIYLEVKRLTALTPPKGIPQLSQTYQISSSRFQSLGDNLADKKRAVAEWLELKTWSVEMKDAITHLQKQTESSTVLEPLQISELEKEISNLSEKCKEWEPKAKALDDLSRKSSTIVRDSGTGNGISAEGVVVQVHDLITGIKLKAGEIKSSTETASLQREKLNKAQEAVTKYLNESQQAVLSAKPQKLDLASMEGVLTQLQKLEEGNKAAESMKAEVQRIGLELIQRTPATGPEVQKIIQLCDADWDKAQATMAEKTAKNKEAVDLLQKFSSAKGELGSVLKEAEQLYNTSLEKEPKDTTAILATLEQLKRCNNILTKAKPLTMSCSQLEDQLKATVSSLGDLDLPVDTEFEKLKLKRDNLTAKLGDKIPQLEAQLVLRKAIEGTKDELIEWLSNTYESLEDAQDNFSGPDMVWQRINKYKNELGDKYNTKMSIVAKIGQLAKLQGNGDDAILKSVIETIEEGFVQVAKLSKELEDTVSKFEDDRQSIKGKLKDVVDKVSAIKDTIVKCEDRTGPPSKIVQRLLDLQKAKAEISTLRPQLESLERSTLELNAKYPETNQSSPDAAEVKAVSKRLDICSTQIDTNEAGLRSVLEKTFWDKYHVTGRLIGVLTEKLKWCDPKTISDGYTLQSKQAALTEIEEGIRECKESLPAMNEAIATLKQVTDYPKIDEVVSDYSKLINDLDFVERNFQNIRSQVNDFQDLWKDYENSSEEVTAWLKDMEGKARNESGALISLAEFPVKISQAEGLLTQAKGFEPKIQKLLSLSAEVMKLSPESRVGQTNVHVNNRMQAILKSLSTHAEQLQKLKADSDVYTKALADANNWITGSEKSLKALEDFLRSSAKPTQSAYAEKIKGLKEFLEGQEGHALIQRTIECGEAIIPGLSNESKESVRGETKKLRETWEGLIDKGRGILKQMEAVQNQWSSLEYNQLNLQAWIENLEKQTGNLADLQPTLAEKKNFLMGQKALLIDVNSRGDVITTHRAKLEELGDQEALQNLAGLTTRFQTLKSNIGQSVAKSEKYIQDHEGFAQALSNLSDNLVETTNEFQRMVQEPITAEEEAEARIAQTRNLLQKQNSVKELVKDCQAKLDRVLTSTHPSGQQSLKDDLKKATDAWDQFFSLCKLTQDELEKTSGKLATFNKEFEDLSLWLKQKETQVKDQSFKSNVEAKALFLDKLQELANEIQSKEPQFAKLANEASSMEGKHEALPNVAQLKSRYSSLTPPLKELISRYSIYVKDHKSFNSNQYKFLDWIKGMRKDLGELMGGAVGDMPALQARRQKLSLLADTQSGKAQELESLVESGEKLYTHTSSDGREVIRQQIKNLRDAWESLSEEMLRSSQNLDTCLSQFGDFTASQEELTKWLRGIEEAMHIHTQLKATLQEKKAQLQSHRIVNQEIASRRPLVAAVCDKAQQLVHTTKDDSLQAYITSIKQLFHNINDKSKDLLQKLEVCVEDHNCLDNEMKGFGEWLALQKNELAGLTVTTGEKADIVKRIEALSALKVESEKGEGYLGKINEIFHRVSTTTSEPGARLIEGKISLANDAYTSYVSGITSVDDKLVQVLKQWEEFEKNLQVNTQLFRQLESIFRTQVLHSTAAEKTEVLKNFIAQRNIVAKNEQVVHAFLDQSNELLRSSNVERVKPLILQISNKYQLLLVLSKEVVNRWQGIVDDHKIYDEKFAEASDLQTKFAGKVKSLEADGNLEGRLQKLQALANERDQALHAINVVMPLGEKLFPDTSATGREKIRNDLRSLKESFDLVDASITDMQKKQALDSQQWASYQESLQQTLAWLTSQEKAAANEQPNWLSPPETRSKLMKLKTILQDSISHRRIVDGIIERAQGLIQRHALPDPTELQETIDGLRTRYEALLDNLLLSITGMEEALDFMQQRIDAQKKVQDWQANLAEQLGLCANYSGGKHALKTRVQRVQELKGSVGEGQALLDALNNILSSMTKTVTPRAKETLERDATNIKFEQDKLVNQLEEVKQGLEDSLKQWGDYEDELDRLSLWLNESEGTLKDYALANTLEEKQGQFEKYLDFSKIVESRSRVVQDFVQLADNAQQALLGNVNENASKFEKAGNDASDLVQSTGDAYVQTNVQQITSRFQAVQSTTKEILKKCELALKDHRAYQENCKKLLDFLSTSEASAHKLKDSSSSQSDLLNKLQGVKELLARRNSAAALLVTVQKTGENLYPTTGTEGSEIIRNQLEDFQRAFDFHFDTLSSIERDMLAKTNRWSGFEEIRTKLKNWLNELSSRFPKELEYKTTLDEKRTQLQKYRNLLQDILSHQQDVFELKDHASHLDQGSDGAIKIAEGIAKDFQELLGKAEKCVADYEGIVCTHQQYVKAVQDYQEWLDGTNSAVQLWSDENQDRITINANLEKLKNLKLTLPDEEYRIDEIRKLGDKVLPGTLESGQPNIRAQLDSTQQEWEALHSLVDSTIQALQHRLGQWSDFEKVKDKCMEWLKATDAKLHAMDLKPNLPTKIQQLKTLEVLQGEVRAQEIEVDSISEKSLNLQRQALPARSSSTSALELTAKYQQVCNKVKELTSKWQDYVSEHQDFETQRQDCEAWLKDAKTKLSFCSDFSTTSQKDLEGKLGAIHDLILSKDDGYAKVQSTIETAQTVLANTAPEGHQEINDYLEALQSEWSSLAAKMLDTKNQLDQNIHLWAGFLEQIQQLEKTVEYADSVLQDVIPFLGTMQEKRAQLESIKSLDEKLSCEKNEVDSLNVQVSDMIASGQQSNAATQALEVLKKFEQIFKAVKQLRSQREIQYRDHRAYKEAHDELLGWLSRAREKIPTLRQRSLGDKLFDIESANTTFISLMNKKPQGLLLIENLQQCGEVVLTSISETGKLTVKAEIRALVESFEGLFKEIEEQKNSLGSVMALLREWKEEYERLSDWLQQCDILIKAAKTNMMATLDEKAKQVGDVKEVLKKLEDGEEQMGKFNRSAKPLLASHLDTYVANQLRLLNSRYQVLLNMGHDVVKKVETNLEQHQAFLTNYDASQDWIANAREVVRESLESISNTKKERLQAGLAKVQDLTDHLEEGQTLVHACVSWGEKAVRNTRSDGKDAINDKVKEIQTEWDKIVKKIATAKVTLESNMLQWADYNSSYSQVQQWLSDRENKLQQVAAEQKGGRGKKAAAGSSAVPGMSTFSIGDRKATLRATNTIVQDIVSLEPMIESVTTKAGNLMQEAPASEISSKYQNLTKQAQEMYAKQKEMVEHHQAFVDLANEFMAWVRVAKEKLSKVSEPIGDRDALSGKIAQLTVLQADVSVGQGKLDVALAKGNDACDIVDDEDRDVIEEEVAVLQEEFDNYCENLNKTQQLLEFGLVGWKEWEEQYHEAEAWLSKAESEVKSFHKLQNSLTDKKNALEQFQQKLQSVFDWQRDLDNLNLKAQHLLETCADSRISNAVTQVSTKFNALLSLAKEVIRRLELQYQEHQQYNTLSTECLDWFEKIREKLTNLSELSYDLADSNARLQSLKGLKQILEQGQNKLRYVLELKEKVMLATEPSGATKIEEDTNLLKAEFEKVMADVQDVRQKLTARVALLEEFEKAFKNLSEWLQEIESKSNLGSGDLLYSDLTDKRTCLERLKGIGKEVLAQGDSFTKFELKIQDLPSTAKSNYSPVVQAYGGLISSLQARILELEKIVNEHEKYKQQLNTTSDFLRKARLDLQQFSDAHGERSSVQRRLEALDNFIHSLSTGETEVGKTKELGQLVKETSNSEGKDTISHECRQVSTDFENIKSLAIESQQNLRKCLESWDEYDKICQATNLTLTNLETKLRAVPTADKATSADLELCKKILADTLLSKSTIEDLSDKVDGLVELSASSEIRNSYVNLQSKFSRLCAEAQAHISRIQKGLSDHTEFDKAKAEMEEWLTRAEGTLEDCSGVGDRSFLQEKLETLKIVSTRGTEGQHLFSLVEEAYTHVLNLVPSETQNSMRKDLSSLRERLEKLNLGLKQGTLRLRDALSKWESFEEDKQAFEKWYASTQKALVEVPEIKELGDMKTRNERFRVIGNEIKAEKLVLDNLEKEAQELSTWSNDKGLISSVQVLKDKWDELNRSVTKQSAELQEEIKEYMKYHNALQEIEKWLLQTSFQLMAHNSLCITNREQTLDQLSAHETLLDEIQKYQAVINSVKATGNEQVKRYSATVPTIKQTTEKQLLNVQDSYDSLLHTALQIKKRLVESLAKFQEYEDTLESIMRNLDEMEPVISENLEGPVRNINESSQKMEKFRSLHNKLQGEKNRLSLSVQACEAAMASLSRPTSPQESILQPIPDKELAVRARLEDFIDQIQSQMTKLSSATLDLEEIRSGKDGINQWADDAFNTLKEVQSRPVKLRQESSQLEINQLQDIINGIAERQMTVQNLESQETGLVREKYLPDLENKLNRLEIEAKKVIDARLDSQSKLEDYRTLVSSIQAWLDGISNKLQSLERGSGLPCQEKINQIKLITSEFAEGDKRLGLLRSIAGETASNLSSSDAQVLQEQLEGLQRRFTEMKKRAERRKQLLEAAKKNCDEFRKTLEQSKTPGFSPNAKIGWEVGNAESLQYAMKTKLKDLDGQQVILNSLDRRLNSIKPELEDKEIREMEQELTAAIAEHANLCESLRNFTLELNDALGVRRKFKDDEERVKAWIGRLSMEIFESSTIPLNAADVERKINELGRMESLISDYLNTNFAELTMEATSLSRDCDESQKRSLNALMSGLKNEILNIKISAEGLKLKFSDALLQRQEFEKKYSECETWIRQAETFLASDVRSLTNVDALKEQLTKYKSLEEESQKLSLDVQSLNQIAQTISPSLNEADKLILKDKLAFLNSKMGTVYANITSKLGSVESILKELLEATNILEERRKFLARKRKEFDELNRPVGSKIEELQSLLSAHESLLADVKKDRIKPDSPKLVSNDLRAIVKEEESLIGDVEEQITRLRHLLLLQQQYLAAVGEISNFIDKWTESVKEIEKSGGHVEEKIRRYDDVIGRIQECEAQLSTATDKGLRLAEEGTTADRNGITEQLQSLKQQLHTLKLNVEDKKSEHEITATEQKKYAAELDATIAWLHERETLLKSRPMLEKSLGSVETELRNHDKLADEVSQQLLTLEAIQEALKNEDYLPPTLMDKLSESRLLTKTFPLELEERRKYLEGHKDLREQFKRNCEGIRKWAKDAGLKLKGDSDAGIDFSNIQSQLTDHKAYFGNEKGILQQLQNIRQNVDKMWPSLGDGEQEALSKELQDLNELIQNTFNSAKSRQANMEQCVILWNKYLELVESVENVIQNAEVSEEPATTLAALKNILNLCQTGITAMQNQAGEFETLREVAKGAEAKSDGNNRSKIQNQMEHLTQAWKKCLSNLETKREVTGKLVNQWEHCEILWQSFESGLSGIEEHFSQIDPSIRSHQQLQDTKEAVKNVLEEAKSLSKTHADLLHYGDFILKHLSSASDICHSALKSKLDNLSTQYTKILGLLEEKLHWLNSQDQYLEEVDGKISALLKNVQTIAEELKEVRPFDPDIFGVDRKVMELEGRVSEAGKSSQEFSTALKNRFSSLKQLLPPTISKNISNLELEIEKLEAALGETKQQLKRARSALVDYKAESAAIQKWITGAEERLQNIAVEPHLLKENIQGLVSQLPAILDKMEGVKGLCKLITENTKDGKDRERIQNEVEALDGDLQRVKSLIEERMLKIAESLDSWQRFLQLYNLAMKWIQEKKLFLQAPLTLTSLPETRLKLNNYSMNVKSLKIVGKHLSEMSREIDKVVEISNAGPLHEKLVEVETQKTEIEAQLLERNALLQETTEEWEQCEKKLREVAVWLDKTKQSVESGSLRRKPLRDQLAAYEKLLADIHVQKTKISLSLEKLQVHFKTGIGGDPNIEKEEGELQSKLDNFNGQIKELCTGLESSITSVEKLQEEVQLLRNQLQTAEQQVRHTSSHAYQAMDPQKAEAEHTGWKERLRAIQSKITSKNERVKLLLQSDVPTLPPFDS